MGVNSLGVECPGGGDWQLVSVLEGWGGNNKGVASLEPLLVGPLTMNIHSIFWYATDVTFLGNYFILYGTSIYRALMGI